jgi:hypothetical protein
MSYPYDRTRSQSVETRLSGHWSGEQGGCHLILVRPTRMVPSVNPRIPATLNYFRSNTIDVGADVAKNDIIYST